VSAQAEIRARQRETDYIEKTLAKFPPLTEQQRTQLAELPKPVRVNGGGG